MAWPNGLWPAGHRLCSAGSLLRYGFFTFLVTLAISSLLLFRPSGRVPFFRPAPRPLPDTSYLDILANDTSSASGHPIDDLIAHARRTHEALLLQRSTDLKLAAERYRARRGRHPPPGFEHWVKYALSHDAVVVEQFFDRIYHDIQPFWARDPKETALRAQSWHHVVRVRGGVAEGVGDTKGRVDWLDLWTKLVAEAAKWLPDVDMPINYMDESRILVPWEDIDQHVSKAVAEKSFTPIDQAVTAYTGLAEVDAINATAYDPEWITQNSPQYWEHARVACSPGSPSRNVAALQDFSLPPSFPYDTIAPYSERGYVKNFTGAIDPCVQPHLRAMHGTFIEPVSISTTKELIPLFGGCKLPVNNELLIPGAKYLTNDAFYSGGENHGPPWEDKKVGIVWRGVGSGGRHKKENWTRFHRLRLVEMLNGTTVSRMERNGARAMTFELAPLHWYDYPNRREGKVGEWLQGMSDVGFNNLLCYPRDGNCSYLADHFSEVDSVPMADQYVNKFIPDADGNSFSARFRGLLLSTSLPLKATVYAEWHDDRLQPWLHYAPLDNTFQDLHAVLDYFTRDGKGDAAARMIAETGKTWGEQVLRREDMLLYVWRLLLEFARVCDENRHKLGYVEDMKS